jgi:uncharacterized protein YceK
MRQLLPVLLVALLSLLSGCAAAPKYLERSSEALSRSVYATGDSLILGRVELAKTYNEAAQKLVPPPKQRIPISPARSGASSVVTLPEAYSGLPAVSAGSADYKALTRASDENKLLSDHLVEVETERQKQYEIHNQLLKDYQSSVITIANQGKIIAQKNLHIVVLYLIIGGIAALIGFGIYLKALVPVRIW